MANKKTQSYSVMYGCVFIYPKVVGKKLGLPAVFVLGAITLGGSLMGISGMLIGVPITSAIYRLISEDMEKRELKN